MTTNKSNRSISPKPSLLAQKVRIKGSPRPTNRGNGKANSPPPTFILLSPRRAKSFPNYIGNNRRVSPLNNAPPPRTRSASPTNIPSPPRTLSASPTNIPSPPRTLSASPLNNAPTKNRRVSQAKPQR